MCVKVAPVSRSCRPVIKHINVAKRIANIDVGDLRLGGASHPNAVGGYSTQMCSIALRSIPSRQRPDSRRTSSSGTRSPTFGGLCRARGEPASFQRGSIHFSG